MVRKDNLKLMRLARGDQAPLYEFYDMDEEPCETRNLYQTSRCERQKRVMKAMLDSWWERQRDKYPKDVKSLLKET